MSQPQNGGRACPVCFKRGRACRCGEPDTRLSTAESARTNIIKPEPDVFILQCPRCLNVTEWDRSTSAAPGECWKCHTRRPWNVLKERPPQGRGYVIVMSDKGAQELRGPDYREDPNAWEPDASALRDRITKRGRK